MNQNELDQKVQDLANNNHISVLEAKTKYLTLQSNASNNNEPSSLFDSNLLTQLNPSGFFFQYDKFETKYDDKAKQYYIDLGDNLRLRPLRRDDFERDYMKLLSQLTEIGNVTKHDYEKRFDQMKNCDGTYYTCVVEDTTVNKIIASTTLVFEQKFIRNTGARGRVEDVVVDEGYRGKRLSKILLDVVGQLSEKLGCYKVSLECKDHLKKHYEQFGFLAEDKQNYLCRRFVH
jgi:glucosamine-phosphate N-acetyltransferase